MPRSQSKRQWIAIFAGTSILTAIGAWLVYELLPTDPLARGWAAYIRGDWSYAGEQARQRLRADGNDASALRLLARASVRLGRDSSAISVFTRLGPDVLTADDLCLLGIALMRSGNPRGIEALEQARLAEPNHAETLFELTRAYAARDRLADAASAGQRLAECRGWQGRANALLGAIELARNDPAAAVAYWRRSLERKAPENRPEPAPIVSPNELATALLRMHQPEEARLRLENALAEKPDREGSWLLSRAYLQLGMTANALAAREKAVPFRDENPLLPEPSPHVGSSRCAGCHPAIFQSQQDSRHAHTFFRASELTALKLPRELFADPGKAGVTHTLRRKSNQRIQQETRVDEMIHSAIVEFAFGSGDRGLTLVGRGDSGQAYELRLSKYRTGSGSRWDLTSGHLICPDESARYLGESLSEDSVRRCLACHVTDAQAILKGSGSVAADQGIGCETCHGPGENHILATTTRFPDLAIVDPRMASGPRVVALCARCHSPRRGTVSQDDPSAVRFQGTTLTWSRCFLESQDALDCITCHDPHRNVMTLASHYEAKCLSCHSATVHPGSKQNRSESVSPTPTDGPSSCPVNPADGCITCHMPRVKGVVPYSSFTDHYIRVHPP